MATLSNTATLMTLLLHGTIGLASLVASSEPVTAQAEPTGKSSPEAAGIQLFATPDDSSPLADSVDRNEILAPLAETHGAGGAKWYLVKTKSGVVGWIKAGDTDESKKAERFFKSLPPEPTASTTLNIPTTSSTSAPRGAIIIRVIMTGRQVIVPVTFNHSTHAYLTMDTGATSTVISRRLAHRLALPEVGMTLGHTVGGAIHASLARLESLRVGDAEAANLLVVIHDFAQDPRLEGLLGMDFLGRFQVSLDPKRQVLILAPR